MPGECDNKDYYSQIQPVMAELGSVESYPTLGITDHVGWYTKTTTSDKATIEAGYPQRGRVTRLTADYDQLLNRIDRTLYATTTYKAPVACTDWEPCRYDSETDQIVWQQSSPTPDHEHLRAVPAWGDIDLANDLKQQRRQLDTDVKARIESIIEAYVQEFVTLYGCQDAVSVLDSVGGAYIFGSPEATLLIVDHFGDDPGALGRIMEAFIDRSNDWLRQAETRVNARIDDAAALIQPDWVNNKNRQYKVPLSIHQDIDGVVVPMNPVDITYELSEIEEVDTDLIETAQAWARDFTRVEHTDCIDSLVQHLWPEYYGNHESWKAALEAWVTESREREEVQRQQRQQALQDRSQNRLIDYDGDVTITTSPYDLIDAVENLPIKPLVRQYCAEWEPTGRPNHFNPGSELWKESDSGTSCFVNEAENMFVDVGNPGGTGGPAKFIAFKEGLIDSPDEELTGETYWAAIDALRAHIDDNELPVYIPEAGTTGIDGTEYEQMPYWAVKKAAVVFDICPPDAFIDRGNGYEQFPGSETYDQTLEAITDEGLEHNRETSTQRNARQKVEDYLDDPDSEETPPGLAAVGAMGRVHQDTYTEYRETIVEETTVSEAELDRHRELAQYQQDHGQFIVENNNLHKIKGLPKTTEPVLNFGIDVESFIKIDDSESGSTRQAHLRITPEEASTPAFEKEISPKIFEHPQRFRDEILAERFAVTLDLTDNKLTEEQFLQELKQWIAKQDAPDRIGTKQIGLRIDDGEFVTPNGVITTDGWASDPTTLFIEREIGAETKVELSPTTHPDFDPDAVANMLELLVNSRSPEEFLPVLGWFYAAPFRPYIYAQTGEFNVLSVRGESGSGKTTTLATLWRLFGMDTEPFSCTDTRFVLLATMSSSRSVPMWFDEYKPSDMQDWMTDRLHEFIRKAATGGTAQRGNADQTTESYHLRAPVVISGEEGLIGSAEERRAVQTRFSDSATKAGSETARQLKRLLGEPFRVDGDLEYPETDYDLATHALSYYQYVTTYDAEQFDTAWKAAKQHVERLLQKWDATTDLDDLERQGLQTVVFGYKRLREFASELGADLERFPDKTALNNTLRKLADIDGTGRENHLDRYLQLLTRATLDGALVREQHYTIVYEDTADEELRVNLTRAHDKVTKYARDHDISEDLLGKAGDYRDRCKQAVDDPDSYITTTSQNSPPIGRAVGIDTHVAENSLPDFERHVFVTEDVDPSAGKSSSSDQSASPAVTLSELAPGDDPVTVEVHVEARDLDQPDVIAEKAILVDTTDEIEAVIWDDVHRSFTEGCYYRIKNARVDSYNSTRQLEITNETGLEEIQAGVGHAPSADAGSNQQLTTE